MSEKQNRQIDWLSQSCGAKEGEKGEGPL